MFKNAITIFRVYGIDIRIDPSWLLVAALFVWSLSAQYFPQLLPGLSPTHIYPLALWRRSGFSRRYYCTNWHILLWRYPMA